MYFTKYTLPDTLPDTIQTKNYRDTHDFVQIRIIGEINLYDTFIKVKLQIF